MTTILNPIMADNESKYDRLVKQVERIVRIIDYDEGQPIPQDLVVDQENVGYNEQNVFNNPEREENIPYLVRRDQNADEVLSRLHTQRRYHYQVTRIVEDVLNKMGINVGLMHQPYFIFAFPSAVKMTEVVPMDFFRASLTKNSFTWFSNLRPGSILTWAQLENDFYAQFYWAELNVSLTNLLAI
ncbi:hypothetical protein Ahy_A07g034412 isoform A [Arachis hypogaea]|uniref:Uncharacterized protein n=1 Tax=Arachis hypogaea TaxID=3818 RepID=A0A445CC09_ARAHY|nr:hypothetical protein Ahy_A07g034412 isoform A [Arachis hypogaea]